MRIKIIFLVFIFYIFQSSAENYAEIGLPVVEVYDSFTHKGANQNWWLAQAKNGLIYNGTGTGLNEWDGEQWQIYHTPNKSRIRSLSIGEDDKIYVGTINDIAYYYPNELGVLTYHSLLSDWPLDEKKFGEVWSVASNKYGVMFLTSQYLLFWNGEKVQKIDALVGSHRIFSVDDGFYFKSTTDAHLYSIEFDQKIVIKKTEIELAENTSLRKVFKNKNNRLTLISAKSGIYEINNNQAVLQLDYQQFPENINIFNAIQTSDGYYYLSSLFDGLFIVDSEFKLVKHYSQEHGFGTDTLLSMMEDFQQNIWLSGVPNIIKMIPPHRYSWYKTEDLSKLNEGISLINNQVISFGESVYQLQNGLRLTEPSTFKPITNRKSTVWDVIEFKNHLVYSGTDGVFALPITQDGINTSEIQLIETQFAKHLAIESSTDTLFAAADEGLFRIRYVNNEWQTDKVPKTSRGLFYLAIYKSVIWVGTATQELYKIEYAHDDLNPNKITDYNDLDGLGANNVIPFVTSQGLVIGTNNGLMDFKRDREPELKFIEELPDIFHSNGEDIYRLYEDQQNNLWYRIGAHTGYAYQDKNKQWQTNEQLFKYFPDSGYKDFIKTTDQTLWFSMADGDIFRSNIDLIKAIPQQGRLNIRKITNLDTDEEIYGGLGAPHLPVLNQENNSIRIQFALADNSIVNAKEGNAVLYRHRLLGSGVDKFSKWSMQNNKDFTLLRGGDYQFELEAKDAWDRVSNNRLNFHVLPPWYLTKTAWISYACIILLLLIVSSWMTQRWRTQRLKLRNKELELQVSQRTEKVQAQANELKQQQVLKDRFFTNVSHEFRTPLTLTIAPLEAFLNDNVDLDNTQLHPVKTALKNSKTMLSLVGQVLDINRLESGQFPLRVAHYDVADLINRIINRFEPWAKQHQQKLTAYHTEEPRILYFDQDLIDKCISNLISNAIKYSGYNSCIEVSLITIEGYTGIQVHDNGKGISQEFENILFQRFTQDKASEQISEPGTGIGLALVKELIELHHGRIELLKPSTQSTKAKGCAFVLWLNNDKTIFNKSEISEPVALDTAIEIDDIDHLSSPFLEPQVNKKAIQLNGDITTLLIVDDNHELREFIASRLSTYYRIIEAENGQEGISMAIMNLPDLIISDVMMPVMDGLQMVKELKLNQYTQNIPIILLTAKSSKRETVEGLQSGADDYLTKPFDTSELITRVAGIIKNRKHIRETIKQEMIQKASHLQPTSEFIVKLRNNVLSQLSDPNLSVTSLAESMSMTRFTLNRKCKQELNKTTGQFVTDTRMQQALSLLKLKQYSVSEVAYGTGFDSLAYFSRAFKKYFDKTPSEVGQDYK